MDDTEKTLLMKILELTEQKKEKKKRKPRVYTEEQKDVLRKRLEKARSVKASKSSASKSKSPDLPKVEVKEASPEVSTEVTHTDTDEDEIYDAFGESEY